MTLNHLVVIMVYLRAIQDVCTIAKYLNFLLHALLQTLKKCHIYICKNIPTQGVWIGMPLKIEIISQY